MFGVGLLLSWQGRTSQLGGGNQSTSTSTSTVPKIIEKDSDFDAATKNLEEWTEITCGTTVYNTSIFDGLDDPKWRRTVNLKTCEVLESRPVTKDMLGSAVKIKDDSNT